MPRRNRYKPRSDGRYMAMVGTGNYLPDGRRERITLYASSSKELEAKVDELKLKIKLGEVKKPTHLTLGEYSLEWFKLYKSKREINTKAMYSLVINSYIINDIGDVPLSDLSRSDCQILINLHWDHPKTCQNIALTMKQIIRSAIHDHYLSVSPWQEIDMPKYPKSKHGRILTNLEKKAIAAANLDPKKRAFISLLYGCGLRREEMLALDVKDIDLSLRIVSVTKAIVFDGNHPILKNSPKSESGIRDVPIPDAIVPSLTAYMPSSGILFPAAKFYGYMSRSSYVKFWNSIRNEIIRTADTIDPTVRIEGFTAHVFRHNYCTILYYAGVTTKKAVELMGHSDAKMIMNVYAHLDDGQEKIEDKINSKITQSF